MKELSEELEMEVILFVSEDGVATGDPINDSNPEENEPGMMPEG